MTRGAAGISGSTARTAASALLLLAAAVAVSAGAKTASGTVSPSAPAPIPGASPDTSTPADMPSLPEGTDLPAAPNFDGLSPARARAAEWARKRIVCFCGGCPKLNPGDCQPGCGTEKILLAEIRAQIEQGKSEGETVDWFVAKYGAQILAAPTKKGFNLVAWVGPFAALLAGLALLLLYLRRRAGDEGLSKNAPATPALPEGARGKLDRDWDPFR